MRVNQDKFLKIPHQCYQPKFLPSGNDIPNGTVWKCACGQAWEFNATWLQRLFLSGTWLRVDVKGEPGTEGSPTSSA